MREEDEVRLLARLRECLLKPPTRAVNGSVNDAQQFKDWYRRASRGKPVVLGQLNALINEWEGMNQVEAKVKASEGGPTCD